MCTLSILPQSDSYRLWMNRDEKPSRGAQSLELARLLEGPGRLPQAYPLDGASGGTWIGVNGAGLALALLNEYPAPAPAKARFSRGSLIPSVLDAEDAAGAARRVQAMDPASFGPCLMVFVALRGDFLSLRSDGRAWASQVLARGPRLIASSGVDAEGARRVRGALFQAALAGGPKALAALHRSHVPEPGPTSVCMHRDASRSVSLTEVAAGPGGMALKYWPCPPCEIRDAPPQEARFPQSAPLAAS